MNNAVQISILVKQFLQFATGLDAKYSMPRQKPGNDIYLTYQLNGGQNLSRAINNELLSERKMFTATVQAERARDVQFYVDMIKQASSESAYIYVSDTVRQDPNVETGHIGTIILSYYNSFDTAAPKKIFPAEEVRKLLQAFADRLIFNTNIYSETLGDAFLDRYIVPELDDATLEEILTLQEDIYDQVTSQNS